MVQFDKVWELGIILKIDNSRQRSYVVKLNKNEHIFVRNKLMLFEKI